MFGKSILAGICIAIGALIYLNVGGILGAFLFSIGLFTILHFGFNLYTGKVAYMTTNPKDIRNILIILMGNIIGCCFLFAFPTAAAGSIVAAKLAQSVAAVLFKSILCGILIYIAVEGFKGGNQLITLLAIPTFILCGAEHSIANICFMIAASCFSLEALIFICIVIIGNAIGSILFHRLVDFSKKF